MSQVFAGDAVNNTTATTIPTTTETTVVTGNFLNPPFGNAKAIVLGAVNIATGTGTTAIALKVHRNPNGENVLVGAQESLTVTGGSSYAANIQVADAIPDGRPVQYGVSVFQANATANGNVVFASVAAILISG